MLFQRALIAIKTISVLALLTAVPQGFAQAALFLEQPYGFFGTINPTGHAAVYVEHICADSPVHLRMCAVNEPGVVISRYKGMAGYDWMAIPLVPYLYAVDDPALVPESVNADTVFRMRNAYREKHLDDLGRTLPAGGFFSGGWTELTGTSYDRQLFAFRFQTTRAQDEALIEKLNVRDNKSHFNMLFNNCSDFDRFILDNYFPAKFGRTIFPDAGITTPKHITYTLKRYAAKHPETEFAIYAIPQIPGSRHKSRAIHGVTESLVMNGYVIPIVLLNPYVAGGLVADYLVRGRYSLVPRHPAVLGPDHLEPLIGSSPQVTEALTPSRPAPENLDVSLSQANSVVNSNDAAPVQSHQQ